jgi:uncharacterized protein GlcG (DUF336 family)/quercetin dioxygenase-like cupin family protein
MTPKVLVSLAVLALAGRAESQVLKTRNLGIEGARVAAAAAEAKAKSLGSGSAIAVVDQGGNLLYLERLDGTFAAGPNISIGKARTAALFKKPTKFFEDIVNKGRTTMVALDDFTPLQGGVPILVDGDVVGAIGVSGAASAAQDEEVALAGASAVGGPMSMEPTPSSSSMDIFYLESDKVAAAFKKGMPLLEVADYKIHASHRDKGGEVEIHEAETDIIYVLEGSATFVTGGAIQSARTVSPGEIRGASVDGGTVRTLAKGDVIVVPKGTPHWFKDVNGALNYYVVKVL